MLWCSWSSPDTALLVARAVSGLDVLTGRPAAGGHPGVAGGISGCVIAGVYACVRVPGYTHVCVCVCVCVSCAGTDPCMHSAGSSVLVNDFSPMLGPQKPKVYSATSSRNDSAKSWKSAPCCRPIFTLIPNPKPSHKAWNDSAKSWKKDAPCCWPLPKPKILAQSLTRIS